MKQQEFLKKMGAFVWFPHLTEQTYFFLRLFFAFLFLLVLAVVGISIPTMPKELLLAVTMAGAAGGYFLPRITLQISNHRDNELMMKDIRRLYEYVKIQAKAGMYLTNTLSICYLAIANRRLKQALLELNAKIVATNGLREAVSDFEEKFDNPYIHQFCVIILQSEESGIMTKVLEDMSQQLVDMEKQIMAQKRSRMERKVLLLSLLVFIGIILIAIYQLAASMLGSVGDILR